MQKPDTNNIPATPGVYLYSDEREHVIYVGKAKNLRKRVLSYFRAEGNIPAKTKAMLQQACSLKTIVTGTEKEALLLEASLIKKYRPRYNIVLRDDKDYILFQVNTTARFPRLEIVRRLRPGRAMAGKLLFGPYSSAGAARETWRAIHKMFPLRRCTDRAFANRSRPCLYYHIGQCCAPCVMDVSQEDYAGLVRQVVLLLRGKSGELVAALREEMSRASEALDFEHAALVRDRIKAVGQTVEQQSVVLANKQDMDVIAVAAVDGGLALCVLFVRGGVLLDKRSYFWPDLLLDDVPRLLESFLIQFYQAGLPVPPKIVATWFEKQNLLPDSREQEEMEEEDGGITDESLLAILAELRGGNVTLAAPRSIEEDALVALAVANAGEMRHQPDSIPMAERLQAVFRSSGPIESIEAVDVSHTSGQSTRVGMVSFLHERPEKSGYRNYAVDAGGDDFAALYQWARRRATAGAPWPDLILIDGGKGQIAAVKRAFEEEDVKADFVLAGIAKARTEDGKADRRAGNIADRIFLPGRSNPLNIAPGSPELFFLQHIRDTVHDYAIGRHRKARSNRAMTGELLRVPGVGPGLAKSLWEHFQSLDAMTTASAEELAAIPGIGRKKAASLAERLRELKR